MPEPIHLDDDHQLFYKHRGKLAYDYEVKHTPGWRSPLRVARGHVTGVRGDPRAAMERIGREALGLPPALPLQPGQHIAHVTGVEVTRTATRLRFETVDGKRLELLSPAQPRFRTKATVDRPARWFGEDASNRSELKRRGNRTKAGTPPASTRTWSRRKADRP